MSTFGNRDCQWASRSVSKDFAEGVLTISSGSLFHNMTARRVKAKWRRIDELSLPNEICFTRIKSKLLVMGAGITTINDQGCQHVTGRFESIRRLLNKPAGRPTFVQSHQTVKPVE